MRYFLNSKHNSSLLPFFQPMSLKIPEALQMFHILFSTSPGSFVDFIKRVVSPEVVQDGGPMSTGFSG